MKKILFLLIFPLSLFAQENGLHFGAEIPTQPYIIVNDTNERNLIADNYRYDGLFCYCKSNDITYQLRGGTANTNWASTAETKLGTVTSIATGYGLTGGPITDTGTITADTAALVTFNDTLSNGKIATKYQPFGHWFKSAAAYTRAFSAQNTYYPLAISSVTTTRQTGFTFDNDTIKWTYNAGQPAGVLSFEVNLTVATTASKKFDVEVYNVTDAAQVSGYIRVLTPGTGYYGGYAGTFVDVNASPGDVYLIRVQDEETSYATDSFIVQTIKITARKEQ